MISIDRLRCEYLTDPLAIDEAAPRLSWVISTDHDSRDVRQDAYRVVVASTEEGLQAGIGDLWDSGRVDGDDTFGIAYGGRPLRSREQALWKVTSWCGADEATSAPARWEAGLLDAQAWGGAQWISLPRPFDVSDDHRPCPYLRRRFTWDGGAGSARLTVTAGGIVEAWLNGQRVGGNEHLAPGWTDYNQRVPYVTYAVDGLLRDGENVLGLVLADGWYAGYIGFFGDRDLWGKEPVVRAVLAVGDEPVAVTNTEWEGRFGPLLASDFLQGEISDARLGLGNWSQPTVGAGASVDGWKPVTEATGPTGTLVARRGPGVGVVRELQPIAVSEPDPGSQVFDMGQNMVGRVRLRVNGRAGTIVRIRHAEALDADGRLYTENLRTARSTDVYVLRGGGEEICEPTFTFHGFRYVEVTGHQAPLDASAVTGVVLSSARQLTGTVETSSPLVNQLWSNILWGQLGNFVEVPTDCPQRDERLGWTGDAQVFAGTACYMADVSAFYTKWLDDVTDGQKENGAYPDFAPPFRPSGDGAPGWGDAGVVVPWSVHEMYGDTRILERHLPAMTRWIEHIRSNNDDLLWRKAVGNNYGDWLAPGESAPRDVVATAYFAHSARLVARAAAAIGRETEAKHHHDLADAIAAAFRAEFVQPDGTITGDTQTGYALALRFGLLTDEQRVLAARHLARDIDRRGHLTAGFLGVGHLLPALTDAGLVAQAYRLLENEDYPSWGYTIRHGATTIWERWDGWTEERGFQTPAMNSLNHYSLGAVGRWLYEVVGGVAVDPDRPGFRHVLVHPVPGGSLTWATTTYDSIVGAYRCTWRRAGQNLEVDVTVPPNGSASVVLDGTDVTESGGAVDGAEGVRSVTHEAARTTVEIGSGSYAFVVHQAASAVI